MDNVVDITGMRMLDQSPTTEVKVRGFKNRNKSMSALTDNVSSQFMNRSPMRNNIMDRSPIRPSFVS